MSLARILSRTQLGLAAPLVQVELHQRPGPGGLCDRRTAGTGQLTVRCYCASDTM